MKDVRSLLTAASCLDETTWLESERSEAQPTRSSQWPSWLREDVAMVRPHAVLASNAELTCQSVVV